ncbi:hypothetical protein E2C01_096846 [Portunus trituberculatus]|uniref:Uncharacterized protein n=1 Tax=Portunus trituberculatus TaxID=210409 RepID=A0A5B7K338_PORTR|nr:hypothetical protein [Portunus trituberculatus]
MVKGRRGRGRPKEKYHIEGGVKLMPGAVTRVECFRGTQNRSRWKSSVADAMEEMASDFKQAERGERTGEQTESF